MSMPFASLDLSTNSPPRLTLYFASSLSPKSPSLVSLPIAPRHASVSARSLPSPAERRFRLAVFESEAPIDGADDGGFGFGFGYESFLSVVEALCALSSAALSIGFAVSCAASSSRKAAVAAAVGNRLLACGMVAMAAGIGVGAWIRRRQWQRLCAGAARGGSEVNLLERVGKLEEDLRSSAAIIRVMSRQLEKLGIRFRVTRKALKEPIAETAALAQKNSEATRALAIQEDMLEKELGEIQKVLLAMQEQQRKQLELILAIGKAGKLWETKPERSREQDRIERPDPTADGLKSKEAQQI